MTQTPRRFAPLKDTDWPDEIADLTQGFAGRLNVYRVMAHAPALLRSWVNFRNHVVIDNALGRQRSEVTILRTGHCLDSPYEWAHHVSRGRACGMDDARIASIAGPLDAMAPEDAVIARAVDELFEIKAMSAPTRDALLALVGSQGAFDVIATVGHYSVLGYIANTFDAPLDDDIEAELAARPLKT